MLVHGRSRVVQATLKAAAKGGVSLEAVVVNGADDCGACVAQELREEGITTRIIADAAVAREMEVIDVVLVGAEAVAENGGVVNKVGTLTVACCARAMRRPLYVAAESRGSRGPFLWASAICQMPTWTTRRPTSSSSSSRTWAC